MQNDWKQQALSKVPAVTLGFCFIIIAATTLGETGGDTVTMTLNWGYLAGTALFLAILATLVIAQIRARKFHPFLYWATIVASTTFGTTMADFADRSLGIGYTGGSTLLFLSLMAILAAWHWSEGTISVNTVSSPKVEAFYWAAITFSQTLGTALGDWVADTGGLGYRLWSLVAVGDVAAALVAAQPALQSVDRGLERGIETVGAGLPSDHRAAAVRGDVDLLAGFSLASIIGVLEFDVEQANRAVQPLHAGQLLRDVNPEMVWNLDVTALDHDLRARLIGSLVHVD